MRLVIPAERCARLRARESQDPVDAGVRVELLRFTIIGGVYWIPDRRYAPSGMTASGRHFTISSPVGAPSVTFPVRRLFWYE
jgi:hypothetical protein